ncbi:MAG: Asp-tRNA(Asn)/Glu-tRNA(Gln) amidotransferase subunit GatB [Cyclobacteriaceae bacterium]
MMKLDKKTRSKYTLVIGLEIHVQLQSQGKIFSGDVNQYGSPPNTNISAITLAHPGTLPRLNRTVVEFAVKMGLACGSEITQQTYFDRKNYFYPDLPKGYQITQDKTPICRGGAIPIRLDRLITAQEPRATEVPLHHIHLEEDAGKLMHLENETESRVDYNRAGTPLIEIVTDPVMHYPEEAYAALTEIRKLVRYLEICDGNMEEGSMRCDANVSVMLNDATELGQKVEVKNMNSMRNVQRAIEHEWERQILLLEQGQSIVSETRTFDATTGTTAGMRFKEQLNDYRYFPEPDLSPMSISDEWLEQIRSSMPPLPYTLEQKFSEQYNLPEHDIDVLTESKELALYFDALCQETEHYKAASNWVMGPVKSYFNETGTSISVFPLSRAQLSELISLVMKDKVSFAAASQKLFPALLKTPTASPTELAHSLNLLQESNTESLQSLVEEVLEKFPEKAAAYRKGKKGLLGMFMGEVMKRSKGKANPKIASELLRKALG